MSLNRSTINQSIAVAKTVFNYFGFHMPPWSDWPYQQWEQAGPEYDEVRDCMLGWDVTDFGLGDFSRIGRTLFTMRNGKHNDARYPRPYAEKLILDPENQRAPAHFHVSKREDIICRAGGSIIIRMTSVDGENQPSTQPVISSVDGRRIELGFKETVRLTPGMSITIPPRTVHQFWSEKGSGLLIDGIGYTVSGEVSSVCDDLTDNYFLEATTRFPRINEDEAPRWRLCNEYPPAH